MKMTKLMMAAFMAVGLTLAVSGMASAAAITCGDCHSTPPVDADNCTTTARGLHGTHTNYSSASMPEVVANYGKCAYCHTAVTATGPTATHNNNAVEIDGSGSAMAPTLSFNTGNSTCSNACHSNETATALWGNYTSVGTVKLSCNSCHDDSGATVMSLSGAHATHLGTAITVTGLGAGTNVDCDACHPDNSADLWSQGIADDGTKKAYPHASDGTNVVSDNAMLDAGLSASRGAAATDTCAGACHSNATSDQWGATSLTCSSCHYYEATPTAANNDAATVTLGGGHDTHFAAGKVCADCHSVPSAGDTAHATALPVLATNATVAPGAGTYNSGPKTCANTGVGCHGVTSTTPPWGTTGNGCTTCHSFPDGANWSAGNGHAVQYDTATITNTHLPLATAFNKTTDTYAGLTADAAKCGKCHGTGTHNDGAVDVAGNGNNYCGVGNFTINVTVSGTTANCSNVSCHSGKATPNWY